MDVGHRSRLNILRDLKSPNTEVPVFSENQIRKLEDIGFFDAPASTIYHGDYAGGLFDHSYLVGKELQNMTEKLGLQWERGISPWIIGILHDLCKVDTYKYNAEKAAWEWDSKDVMIKGHGIKSVVYANRILTLTPEEEACILYHMGAFTPEKEWSYYTEAIHHYKNVLYAHTADMIASHIHLT